MDSAPPNANRLRSLADGERPQERMARHGVESLSDTELLAMVLRSGTRGHDVLTLAGELLARAGSLGQLLRWQEADFCQLKGIGKVKAMQLVVVFTLARRVLQEEKHAGLAPHLETPAQIADYLQPHILGLAVEKFWVLCLNRKNRLLKCVEITSGTATNSLAHPREVFREAIRVGATAVVCAHNHPSGDPAPSAPDRAVTRQLREAAQTVQIELHDHLVLGAKAADPLGLGYYSFRAAGLV